MGQRDENLWDLPALEQLQFTSLCLQNTLGEKWPPLHSMRLGTTVAQDNPVENPFAASYDIYSCVLQYKILFKLCIPIQGMFSWKPTEANFREPHSQKSFSEISSSMFSRSCVLVTFADYLNGSWLWSACFADASPSNAMEVITGIFSSWLKGAWVGESV